MAVANQSPLNDTATVSYSGRLPGEYLGVSEGEEDGDSRHWREKKEKPRRRVLRIMMISSVTQEGVLMLIT